MTQQHDSLIVANLFAHQLTVQGLDPRVDGDLDTIIDTDDDGILDADYSNYIEIYAQVEVGSIILWL